MGIPGPRSESVRRVAEAGYDSIEAVLFNAEERKELRVVLRDHRLLFKGVILTRGRSVEDHLSFLWEEQAARGSFPIFFYSFLALV